MQRQRIYGLHRRGYIVCSLRFDHWDDAYSGRSRHDHTTGNSLSTKLQLPLKEGFQRSSLQSSHQCMLHPSSLTCHFCIFRHLFHNKPVLITHICIPEMDDGWWFWQSMTSRMDAQHQKTDALIDMIREPTMSYPTTARPLTVGITSIGLFRDEKSEDMANTSPSTLPLPMRSG